MELYPIFDENTKINKNIWYVISGNGDVPYMRVGHTILHIKSNDDNNDKGDLYLIGGANPSDCFNDIYKFNLNSLSWKKINKNLPSSRYEHSSFLDNYTNSPNFIFIFGGANQEKNLNDIISYDLKCEQWNEIKTHKGSNKPCCRTQHVGCIYKNQLVVFGGGKIASLPVTDQQVHLYDPINNSWSTPNIKGQPPCNRHGHLMINFNDKCVYLHGGMNDQKFYDDLWILDFDACVWSRAKQHKSNKPSPRAAHGGISTKKNLYIFGGLDEKANALGDFWTYSVDEYNWSKVKISGDNPPSRLDYAYCKLKLKYKTNANENNIVSSINSNNSNNNNNNNNDDHDGDDKILKQKIVTVLSAEDLNEKDELEEETKFVLNNEIVKVANIVQNTENSDNTSTIKENEEELNNKISNEIENELKNLNISDDNIEEKEYFLIHGGMDTEGNVFDDCFIINLD